MNVLKLLIPFLLFGCAPTTMELFDEAHRTGDWSQVNEREEAELRREDRRKHRCPYSYVEVCHGSSRATMSCVCVKRGTLR